ncbi:Roadblock/LC7 domain [Delftia tsuruhatensis]|uniref:roadblock/LC7 domain-containing protein n=1 Tax=Delftia tsuruhatensis TaxID=180282 RepID=UPI001E79075C|nr:roadblock/LC7 domain-containing protein [Delftia tsuruhatensis]CAB5700038.1 Roadblock/LC7 domain [Delftia tsuruhatensis]CAC9693582.1 Roadblock/LC7 domain [Delftia tsuruhatensis]
MTTDPALKACAHAVVKALTGKVHGVHGCVVSTEDGFEVAAHAQGQGSTARLSAMASSMAALGAIAGEENQLGACSNVVIEAAEGFIVMLQARRPDLSLVLSVVASREATLGQILYVSREAARMLEQG